MRILMVLSHPDDEIIFGFPFFQRDDLDISLLMCSCGPPKRRSALDLVCAERRFPLQVLTDFKPEFHRLSMVDGSMQRWFDQVTGHILNMSLHHDAIFTHNPHGEYGHPDHKLVFDVVESTATIPVLYSDIHLDIGWPMCRPNPLYFKTPVATAKPDVELYIRLRRIYFQHDAWTWNSDVPPDCRVFRMPTG